MQVLNKKCDENMELIKELKTKHEEEIEKNKKLNLKIGGA